MTARELELENLELRLEIGLLNREKFDLLHEIYDIRREAGLKDPKEIFETRNCGKKTLAEIIELSEKR